MSLFTRSIVLLIVLFLKVFNYTYFIIINIYIIVIIVISNIILFTGFVSIFATIDGVERPFESCYYL